MFNQTYYNRLRLWKDFRNSLETSKTPFEDVIEFWNKAPISSLAADPYDTDTWPTPWEMLKENIYCDFVKILGICYTLQLTERFSQSLFEIHIAINKKEERMMYLLFVDNQAIGYYNDRSVDKSELEHFDSQMQHIMHPFY